MGRISWVMVAIGSLLATTANAQPALQGSSPEQLPLPKSPAAGPVSSAPSALPSQPVTVYDSGYAMSAPTSRRPTIIRRVFNRTFGPEHRYEPDGVPTPLGSGNLFTEFKYVFGSSRQFFGTAESTTGHLYRSTVPPAYRIPYPMEH